MASTTEAAPVFVGSSTAKIKLCDVHTFRPWVVTLDEDGRLVWWDYEQRFARVIPGLVSGRPGAGCRASFDSPHPSVQSSFC